MSEINQELRDKKYNELARRNPAIVSIVFPLLVALYFYQENTAELDKVRYVVGILFSFGAIIPALLFFLQSSIREISVLFVEKPLFAIFGRPAVNLMKENNGSLSQQRKERIVEKVKAAGIEIVYANGNTLKDRKTRYKSTREAFEKIREDCRESSIVFDFNCTYGFFRNLSGGLIVDLLICTGVAIVNCRQQLGIEDKINISFLVLGSLFLFCVICAYFAAVRYAKRVYVLYDN